MFSNKKMNKLCLKTRNLKNCKICQVLGNLTPLTSGAGSSDSRPRYVIPAYCYKTF